MTATPDPDAPECRGPSPLGGATSRCPLRSRCGRSAHVAGTCRTRAPTPWPSLRTRRSGGTPFTFPRTRASSWTSPATSRRQRRHRHGPGLFPDCPWPLSDDQRAGEPWAGQGMGEAPVWLESDSADLIDLLTVGSKSIKLNQSVSDTRHPAVSPTTAASHAKPVERPSSSRLSGHRSPGAPYHATASPPRDPSSSHRLRVTRSFLRFVRLCRTPTERGKPSDDELVRLSPSCR
jgi:hypothetical protein